ncbi:MAG: L-2-amino-thiazoline-4-carboxylic acid hydrolase [Spirochaetes bacterium]|nr:L-2-amino-thiazoline-4-carboxylic acid hydrolase [Spirochaetota bacterium]
MRKYDMIVWIQKRVLRRYLQKPETEKVIRKSRKEFKEVIPKIPYIGGKYPFQAQFLFLSTYLLGLVKVLKKEGFPKEKIGKVIFEMADFNYHLIPIPLRWIIRSYYFSKRELNRWRRVAQASRLKQYPADGIVDFVEGNGTFAYGLDVRECALMKFWKSQGLKEYVPYLCLTDWSLWHVLGVEVKRTTTISHGKRVCDFRIVKKRKNCSRGWPPESLDEWPKKKK